MRPLVIASIVALASCYSPRIERCRVTCVDSDLCPGAQICLDDNFCHEPSDTASCTPDAEPPPIDAEIPDAEIPDAEIPDAEIPPPPVVTTIAAGGHHACALDADGALWCWGSNRRGQLGLGPGVTRSLVPVRIGDDLTWTAVDAGEDHTCGINAGELFCWGANSSGMAIDTEHGSGDVYAIEEADSGPATGWVAVTTGARHTCAIHDNGAGVRTVYCGGSDSGGQLGDSGGDDSGPVLRVVASTTDGPVTDWSMVHASGDHTCALRPSGEAYCWGLNNVGQVGDGVTTSDRRVPTRVTATVEDGAVPFGVISAGDVMTCAIGDGAALGRLYCWGDNGYGQLGDPAFPINVPVPRRVGTGTDWSHIAASYVGICGARADGVYCWGDGSYGNVGNGAWEYEGSPQHVVGLDVAMSVAVGYHEACAAPPTGGVRCWGANVEGELGNGFASTKHEPTAIAPVDGQWTAVATAMNQTCGIHAGVVRCWGWNERRQVLGVASSDAVLTPTVVPGLPAGTATSVSAAGTVSCAIVDEGGGEAHPWCWGYNQSGELGVGTTSSYRAPSEVSNTGTWTGLTQTERATCALVGTERRCWGNGNGYGLGNNSNGNVTAPEPADALAWSKVRLGGYFGCGIRDATGELWCWGSDSYGKQGDGAGTTDAMTPHRVGGTSTFVDVAPAWFGDHACAIDATTQDLICWGLNNYGQCGTDSATQLDAPTSINSGTWTALAAGQLHSCGIKNDGTDTGQLWCWGNQQERQVGVDIVQSYFDAPERIGTDVGWTAVAAGTRHTCGVRAGNLYCWGANLHGQLGDGTSSHATPVSVMFP